MLPVITALPALVWYLYRHDPERWSRLTSFLTPELLQKTDAYQLWNSLLALGSGGWFGIGFMESRLKAKYLPEAHTDFILSIVGEELGLLAMLLVIAAYMLFMFFALKISLNAKRRQAMLLGVGVTMLIVLQAFVNIGVISGALPTKGMPAPLISYGGSNLLMCWIGIGLLAGIALENIYPDYSRVLWERLNRVLHRRLR
jgi:cell division protein FtsW